MRRGEVRKAEERRSGGERKSTLKQWSTKKLDARKQVGRGMRASRNPQ